MIKLVYCITRKPGMTEEEFSHYWRHVHAHIGARIPGVRRFVQSGRIIVPGDRHQGDFDGMVELWFDNVEALLAARESREWKASLQTMKQISSTTPGWPTLFQKSTSSWINLNLDARSKDADSKRGP